MVIWSAFVRNGYPWCFALSWNGTCYDTCKVKKRIPNASTGFLQ